MTLIGAYGLALTLISAVGAFAIGRLTVCVTRMKNVIAKALLYLVIALIGAYIAISPVFYLAFGFFEEVQEFKVEHSSSGLYGLILSISYLVYWAVLYLSFRMATGRVHGHG